MGELVVLSQICFVQRSFCRFMHAEPSRIPSLCVSLSVCSVVMLGHVNGRLESQSHCLCCGSVCLLRVSPASCKTCTVMQAARKNLGKSALGWFIALKRWYPDNVKVQQLSEVAANLLQHDQQKRPSMSALLKALQTMAAQQ